jgi:hypothetical protein
MMAAWAGAFAQSPPSTDPAKSSTPSGASTTRSAERPVDDCTTPAFGVAATQQDKSVFPLQITGLFRAPDFSGNEPVCILGEKSAERVGLNDELWVQVEPISVADATEKPKTTLADVAPAAAATPPGTVPAPPTAVATTTRSAPDSSPPKQPDARPPMPIDADDYVLFLNGGEVKGIGSPTLRAYKIGDSEKRALVFHLRRNPDNKELWTALLGSPSHFWKRVSVTLALKDNDGRTLAPSITGAKGAPTFCFLIISGPWLAIAVLATLFVLYLVWGHVSTRTTLRDNLLPQLAPARQAFSLGRCQMAFWFVLIFASFIFLYILLWDYNTVSTQALALMGIASATALAAVGVDVAKDSPADAANRALQALGINVYADVDRIKQEIAFRAPLVSPAQEDFRTKQTAAKLARTAADAAPADAKLSEDAKAAEELASVAEKQLEQLQMEIQDRNNTVRTYDDKTAQFASRGLFSDLTTDINGPTIHRLQVIFWTIALGIVFIVGVYRGLAMPPDFSSTLLVLMGISGAGYVGFKYPEKNN